ncbi:MAG: choice-of-anchor D domain-containing protein [bacterium]|nr:choice-of-anchor D domain-containing protein [bacterium]
MNHNALHRFAFIFLCLLLHAGIAVAQPDVDIYWDETDKLDTVIDFDVTLEGFPVYRTFTVRNRSPYSVTIPLNLDPFFVILNTPDVEPSHPRKEEFGADDALPFVIPPDSTRSFRLIFKAFKDNSLFPPDTIAEARLFLKIVKLGDNTGPGVSKVFLLRALKTTHPLASTTKRLPFDSVYVHPNPVPSLKYRIRNVSQAPITIDTQISRPRTQITTQQPELRVTTFSQVIFAGRDSIEWTAVYEPENLGFDSLDFIVRYKATDTSPIDSVVVGLSGVGVEQRIKFDKAEGVPTAIFSRDTIGGIVVDFLEVPANGSSVVGTIVIKNDGNLNLGYDDERHVGLVRDTLAFPIRQRWSGGRGGGAGRGDFDTLTVAFSPTSSGDHRSAYVLTTDIKRRNIKGIPDGANTFTVYLRGFGQRPQLQVPASIDFGTIVHLPGCASRSERTLRVANVGNALLKVDSIVIAQGTGAVSTNAVSFTVNPGGSTDLLLTYNSTEVGADSGLITLFTNALTSRVEVVYRAQIVPRDSTFASFPARITSRPGSRVSIPLIVDGASVALTNRTAFTATFNPSLLKFESIRTQGTASEGSITVQATESPRGVVKIELDKNGNFVPRDTLVYLVFNTFLGSQISSELALANSTTTFGNAGCVSVLDVRTTSGLYALDSICGLDYKTSGGTLAIQAEVFPNPASERASIALVVSDTTEVSVTMRDALGRSVLHFQAEVFLPGSYIIPLDLHGQQTATYYVDVRSTLLNRTLPLVVRQ